MNKLITLIAVLLATTHFNASAQTDINNFKLDKMNLKAKLAKRHRIETYKHEIKKASNRKALYDKMMAHHKSPNDTVTTAGSLAQAAQAYTDALDTAKKQLDLLAANPDKADPALLNQAGKAVRKAQRKYERVARNVHAIELKLTYAGTLLPAADTGVEAESAPGDDEVTAVDSGINISTAAKGTLTVTATTSDVPVNKNWTGFIFASGTITTAADILSISNPSSNLTIGGVINYRRNTIMFSYNPKAATSTDTGNLIKSFLFPEITARAFVIEYDRGLFNGLAENNGSGSINYFLNLSTSYIENPSNNTITPYNMITGFRFSMHKDLSNASSTDAQNLKDLSFSISPYFSLITIDPKDFNNYDSTFLKPNGPPNINIKTTVQALGAKIEFAVGSLNIFFDYKYVLNGGTDEVFNTSFYTLGASVNTSLFSF